MRHLRSHIVLLAGHNRLQRPAAGVVPDGMAVEGRDGPRVPGVDHRYCSKTFLSKIFLSFPKKCPIYTTKFSDYCVYSFTQNCHKFLFFYPPQAPTTQPNDLL